jgi:ribosomal protein S18 acetylase RimI-like enzyme
MRHGEEDRVRELLARLEYEDQFLWKKRTKPLSEYMAKRSGIPVRKRIEGKNVILVAEENGMIAGLCWITIVDRGVDKQGEIAEFFVEKDYRCRGVGRELLTAAKQLFIDEQVQVAFVWTHRENEAAIRLFENAGFKRVTQVVMAFVSPYQEGS